MQNMTLIKGSQLLLELDRQGDGIQKDVNLEDADEEETKMFKHLSKEIPEEADIWCEVWY